jgi:hypothetical protein
MCWPEVLFFAPFVVGHRVGRYYTAREMTWYSPYQGLCADMRFVAVDDSGALVNTGPVLTKKLGKGLLRIQAVCRRPD